MGAIDGRGRIETYEEALAWIEDSAETAIIHIDAEALERDFAEFVREAWPIVDPSEYIHNWHIDALADHLMAVNEGEIRRLLINLPPRTGKQIADDTPVLTLDGWKTHGDLCVGDFVFHPSGAPTEVLAVSDKTPADVRVEFFDGSVIYCHERHEWRLFNRAGKRGWETVEAGAFLAPRRGRWGQTNGSQKRVLSDGRAMHQLPPVSPLQFPAAHLPLHPYVLGAWLGDGTTVKPTITHARGDQAYIDRIVSLGHPISSVAVHKQTGVLSTSFYGEARLRPLLEEVGVFGRKHIPRAYLQADIEQRLELLAGLIDTDGTIDAQARCHICSVSRPLVDGIVELVRSFGWRASVSEVEPSLSSSGIQGKQRYWVVGFQPRLPVPTVLPRKRVTRFADKRLIGLRSVTHDPCGKVGHCIQVAAPDGLYLVGHGLTPTHNSQITSALWPAWTWAQRRKQGFPLQGPQVRFLCLSYAQGLALDMARHHRQVLVSPWYRERWGNRVILDRENDRIDEFATTAKGVRYSVGFGGTILGRGGDIKIIDDPHNPDEIESESQLETAIRRFDEEISMRITDPRTSAEIVQMQRLGEGDISGHILEKMGEDGEDVVHLCLPMEYDPRRHCVTVLGWEDPRGLDADGNELEGRDEDAPDGIWPDSPLAEAEGQLLWPERIPHSEIVKLKTRLGPFGYAGRMQQAPTTRGAGILQPQWWQVWQSRNNPEFSTVVVSLDTSSSAKETNDEIGLTAWGAWADDDGRPQIMLIDAWEGFEQFDPMVKRTIEMCRAPNGNATCPADYLLVEAKNVGEAVIQEVIRLQALRNWQVVPINPTIDKVARARAIQHMFSGQYREDDATGMKGWTGGVVWAPNTDWAQKVIDRCAQFPKAKRKGLVDTVTQAIKWLRDNGIILRTEEHEEEKREEAAYVKPYVPPYEA